MKTSNRGHVLAGLILGGCPQPIVVGDNPVDGSSGGSTTVGESTTSGAPTTSGGTTTEATTAAESSTGEASTGAITSAGSTGTSGTGGDSTGAASTGGDGGSTTGSDDALVLDPATLEVFNLPINSIRYAVAGHDAAHDMCVSIIWFEPPPGEHCDDFGAPPDEPYVWIEEEASPPCMGWGYAGNVELVAASGCYEFVSFEPPAVSLAMTLEVVGDLFTGTITVDNK
jgi:hypothetical protein